MNAKPWYQSTTYYALAVAIATKIFMMAGLAENEAGKQAGELVTLLLPFIGICADLVAAWGRKRAQGPVTLTSAEAKVQNSQGGFVRPALLAALLLIAAPTLLLVGCVTSPHKVIETACTPGTTYSVERCVKGIAETWETYQIRAEIIVADPLTPAEVKSSVQRAEAASRPVVVHTLLAGGVYAEIKQRVAAGETEAEKLAIANANLEAWVAKALPLVRNFGRQLDR